MVAAVSAPVNPNKAAALAPAATTRRATARGGGGGGARANHSRPPLLPSEPDNALAARRPMGREVTSRYLSSASSTTSSSASSTSSSASSCSSRGCPSPLISRTAAMTPSSAAAKRSQSAERRPATPRLNKDGLRGGGGAKGGELTAAQKLLLTSARNLSVSFQGESYSLTVSKAKPSPAPSSTGKGTPERRKPVAAATPRRKQLENSKPVEKQRWPGRSRQGNFMSRSVDFGDDRRRTGGSRGNVVGALQTSMMVDVRASRDGRLPDSDSSDHVLGKANEVDVERNSGLQTNGRTDCSSSDSESLSSGSTSEVQECGSGQGQHGPRGVVVPARFWQETINRMRPQPEDGTPLWTGPVLKMCSTPKLVVPKKPGFGSPVSSPKGILSYRGQASPVHGAVRPASPSKLTHLAVSAGTPLDVSASNIPSILSFVAEARRGKIGQNRIVDALVLRLLHNHLLQWRFVNARADEALSAQTLHAERSIYTAWLSIFKLRESVKTKRIELQLQRQNLKLTSVVHGQIRYLEEWASIDQDYSNSLSGATEALRASTLRLPVIGGARVDIQKVKNAISSAVEVMQAMASSICLFSSEVGNVNNLMAELARATSQERAVLDQCRDLLSTIAAMQVNESSLRTHLLQVQCALSTSSITAEK
ncbi:QWRF motif-containing protein 2-like [Rhodamnia argentea]|uniref:QWRF motif-containing protein 2-like n=1 Tax=Rhodamnia argentea TaxID=178133 RepID=A0A8B8P3M4_9MYRT|nr:QWRF motif-containing protein 2-like [Rhodamnia argentea]